MHIGPRTYERRAQGSHEWIRRIGDHMYYFAAYTASDGSKGMRVTRHPYGDFFSKERVHEWWDFAPPAVAEVVLPLPPYPGKPAIGPPPVEGASDA